jgi:flagellar motor switch protein FliN/FliY
MAKASATAEKEQKEQTPQDQATQADSQGQVTAQQVELTEAASDQGGGGKSSGKLDIVLDMYVPITVAVGQTQIPVRRLLQLGPGLVLKLDKPIDTPADLFLKNTRFGTGDVVVVDGKFAVRIKQIIGTGNGDTAEK